MSEARSFVANFFVKPEPWMKDGACRDYPTSLFFPERGSSTRKAKAICAGCSVRVLCREYAERTETEYGIWDGEVRKRGADSIESESSVVMVDPPNPTSGVPVELRSLSATAANTYELCPARWKAEYGTSPKPPDMSGTAAEKGTVCHAAAQRWVEEGWYKRDDVGWDDFAVIVREEYAKLFPDDTELKDCLAWMKVWWERTDLINGRTILSTEKRDHFPLKVSDSRSVRFNFVIDRLDVLDDGTIEVVDYKSSILPVQPADLENKIQPRAYAVAAMIKHPTATSVKVTFDMLRHDPVSYTFTRDECVATFKYLRDLARRIIADDTAKEKLNEECRFCIRRFQCKTLLRHVDAGGALSISDPNTAADMRDQMHNQVAAMTKMIETLDEYLMKHLESEDIFDFETPAGVVVKVTARRNRFVDPLVVTDIVGAEMVARLGGVKIGSVDAMLEGTELTAEQKSALRQSIQKKAGNPSIKTTQKKAVAA